MWFFFGVIAIVTALLNITWTVMRKDAKWVINEDWSALMDVTPAVSKCLWICTIASIVINSVSLFKRPER